MRKQKFGCCHQQEKLEKFKIATSIEFRMRVESCPGKVDSVRPLKMSCGIWHQDVSSRFQTFWKCGGRACDFKGTVPEGGLTTCWVIPDLGCCLLRRPLMWATNVQRTVTQICVHLSADASKVQASLALAGKFGIAASFADIHIHCRDISNRASASPRMSSFSHRIQSDIQFMISCISRFSPLLILSTFHPPTPLYSTGKQAWEHQVCLRGSVEYWQSL